MAVIAGMVMAYLLHPVFKKLNKKFKNEAVTAFVISMVIIILLAVPSVFLIKETSDEARFFYITAKQKLFNGAFLNIDCPNEEAPFCQLTAGVRDFISQPEVRVYIESGIVKFSDFILTEASSWIFSLPRIFLLLFVAFFVCFYGTLEGESWAKKFKKLLPIKKKYQRQIFKKIDNITHAVIYGSLFIAIIQGTLGGIGFFIFGVNSPVLFGILMAVFALIPFLGTAIIWVPASLMMVLEGFVDNETGVLIRGVLLLVYGALIISTVDNILKPRLIGKQAEVHPITVLVGVLGGISLMGFIGFVVGPLIISLFIAFLEVYEKEKEAFLR